MGQAAEAAPTNLGGSEVSQVEVVLSSSEERATYSRPFNRHANLLTIFFKFIR